MTWLFDTATGKFSGFRRRLKMAIDVFRYRHVLQFCMDDVRKYEPGEMVDHSLTWANFRNDGAILVAQTVISQVACAVQVPLEIEEMTRAAAPEGK